MPGMLTSRLTTIVAGLLALGACSPLPVRTELSVEPVRSFNYGHRRPNYVVLHYTASSDVQRALGTLRNPLAEVSAHYLIGRDGRIYYLVDEHARAWHAGASWWGGNRDLNSASIGIELDNNGDEPYAEPQVASLLNLLADLKKRYSIPVANFLGHSDIAPGRKSDPGRHFPWRRLAQQGFGLWCDSPPQDSVAESDGPLLLAALGYDVSDLPAAIRAFKLRYAPDQEIENLTRDDHRILRCLIDMKHRR